MIAVDRELLGLRGAGETGQPLCIHELLGERERVHPPQPQVVGHGAVRRDVSLLRTLELVAGGAYPQLVGLRRETSGWERVPALTVSDHRHRHGPGLRADEDALHGTLRLRRHHAGQARRAAAGGGSSRRTRRADRHECQHQGYAESSSHQSVSHQVSCAHRDGSNRLPVDYQSKPTLTRAVTGLRTMFGVGHVAFNSGV